MNINICQLRVTELNSRSVRYDQANDHLRNRQHGSFQIYQKARLSVENPHSILDEQFGGSFVLTRSYCHKRLESAHSRFSVGRIWKEIRLRIRFDIGLVVVRLRLYGSITLGLVSDCEF